MPQLGGAWWTEGRRPARAGRMRGGRGRPDEYPRLPGCRKGERATCAPPLAPEGARPQFCVRRQHAGQSTRIAGRGAYMVAIIPFTYLVHKLPIYIALY